MRAKNKPIWLIVVCILICTLGYAYGSWGLPWYLKYVSQLGIVMIAGMWMFVTGDFGRLKHIRTFFWIYGVPFAGMLMISMFFWLLDFQKINYISRGCSTILYHVISLSFVCAAVYLFGGKAIEYNLYAMILANIAIVLYSLKLYGVGEFATGLIAFVKSGGVDTNAAIKCLEVHDLTFAFGLYLFYYLLFEKGKKKWILMIPILIFNFTGYKRIAMLGIGCVFLLHWILHFFNSKIQIGCIKIFTVLGIVCCFFYVFFIHSSLFNMIVEYFEIDTMGRKELYDAFRPIYEFRPDFRGYGIGYVTRYISIMTEEGIGIFGTHGFGGLHNDIVTLYIELGFWGFGFWVWYNIRFRILWILKKYDLDTTKLLVYGTVYTYVTYATDNTVFYCYINTIFMLLPLAYAVKRKELEKEEIV